jgi:hypothetical protein
VIKFYKENKFYIINPVLKLSVEEGEKEFRMYPQTTGHDVVFDWLS